MNLVQNAPPPENNTRSISKNKQFTGKNNQQFNFIAKKYDFRFNVVHNCYEWRLIDADPLSGRKGNKWERYEDDKRHSMLVELMGCDLELKKTDFDTFIESNQMSPHYNPFEEYFDKLPKYDEDHDYIEEMANTIDSHDQERFKDTFKKFLVGTIDCLLRPDAVNDVCLIFQSPQGLGKSRWMRKLLPGAFKRDYLYEGSIDTKNKDHTMYLSQFWFIHLDELEALRSNAITAIKSYITRGIINERKSYGRYTTKFVRRASFLGSVNDDKFLSDITGNRRWLVFKVFGINYQHNIDVDKLWAQAFALWKDESFRHWFNIEEIKEINEHNEEFRIVMFEEEILIKNFEFNDENGLGQWYSSSDVMMKVGEMTPSIMSKLHNVLMGKALSKLAIAKKVEKGYTKYWLNYTGKEKSTGNDWVSDPNSRTESNTEAVDEKDDLPF